MHDFIELDFHILSRDMMYLLVGMYIGMYLGKYRY